MSSSLYSPSEKLKKAITWVSEMGELHPEKSRKRILQEAEIRFDLSPADCTFLDKNFSSPEQGLDNP